MSNINRRVAALFDLDGVLVDTEGIYTQFWSDMDRRYPTRVENFASVIKGSTLPVILSRYFPEPEVQHEICALLADFEENMPYRVFDGVTDFLADLRNHGIKAAIVTSSGSKKMEHLFKLVPGFRDFFAAVLTDADVSRSKPDPEPYLKGAEKAGVHPEECIVFEDSFQGLESGRRAGCRVIGLSTTNPAEAIAPKADMVAPSLATLVSEIESMLA